MSADERNWRIEGVNFMLATYKKLKTISLPTYQEISHEVNGLTSNIRALYANHCIFCTMCHTSAIMELYEMPRNCEATAREIHTCTGLARFY